MEGAARLLLEGVEGATKSSAEVARSALEAAAIESISEENSLALKVLSDTVTNAAEHERIATAFNTLLSEKSLAGITKSSISATERATQTALLAEKSNIASFLTKEELYSLNLLSDNIADSIPDIAHNALRRFSLKEENTLLGLIRSSSTRSIFSNTEIVTGSLKDVSDIESTVTKALQKAAMEEPEIGRAIGKLYKTAKVIAAGGAIAYCASWITRYIADKSGPFLIRSNGTFTKEQQVNDYLKGNGDEKHLVNRQLHRVSFLAETHAPFSDQTSKFVSNEDINNEPITESSNNVYMSKKSIKQNSEADIYVKGESTSDYLPSKHIQNNYYTERIRNESINEGTETKKHFKRYNPENERDRKTTGTIKRKLARTSHSIQKQSTQVRQADSKHKALVKLNIPATRKTQRNFQLNNPQWTKTFNGGNSGKHAERENTPRIVEGGNKFSNLRIKDPYPCGFANKIGDINHPFDSIIRKYTPFPCTDWQKWDACGGWASFSPTSRIMQTFSREHQHEAAIRLQGSKLSCEKVSIKQAFVALVHEAGHTIGSLIKEVSVGFAEGLGISRKLMWYMLAIVCSGATALFTSKMAKAAGVKKPWIALILSVFVAAVVFLLFTRVTKNWYRPLGKQS